MRLIWSGFLLTGLLMLGLSVYERRELRDAQSRYEDGGVIHASEDGMPFPPTPTPGPRQN
ncbi:MAG: hypothetical protein U0599_05330 [Vicinamibacteria bacterium]